MRTILLKTWRRTGASVSGDRSWAFKEKREMLKRWGKWKHMSIQNTCPQMFIAAQFIRAKIWNNLNFQKLMNGKTKCGTIQWNIQVSKGKKYWYTLQHGGTTNTKLRKISQVLHIIIFHMWKSRTAKSIETESTFVVA